MLFREKYQEKRVIKRGFFAKKLALKQKSELWLQKMQR